MIANLKYAARNCETITIGGGRFGPDELLEAAEQLQSAQRALQVIEDLLEHGEFDDYPNTRQWHAVQAARALVKKEVSPC